MFEKQVARGMAVLDEYCGTKAWVLNIDLGEPATVIGLGSSRYHQRLGRQLELVLQHDRELIQTEQP